MRRLLRGRFACLLSRGRHAALRRQPEHRDLEQGRARGRSQRASAQETATQAQSAARLDEHDDDAPHRDGRHRRGLQQLHLFAAEAGRDRDGQASAA